jgi:hypothetical protein
MTTMAQPDPALVRFIEHVERIKAAIERDRQRAAELGAAPATARPAGDERRCGCAATCPR